MKVKFYVEAKIQNKTLSLQQSDKEKWFSYHFETTEV
jgi:hypothetical protein